jgi:hypothetical protein
MIGRVLTGIKRFILWDYPRASWQYDVMVGVILAFLFLTPRDWFRDQRRDAQTSRIAVLPAAHGTNVFWIDPEVLAGVPENDRLARAGEKLKQLTGGKQALLRLEPVFNSEKEITGYLVVTHP